MKTMALDDVLQSEREFFDRHTDNLQDEDLRLLADQIERYRNARPRAANTAKDALFAALSRCTASASSSTAAARVNCRANWRCAARR
jgi:hypothetical protein